MKLNCSFCGSKESVTKVRKFKNSPIMVFFGFFIAVPTLLIGFISSFALTTTIINLWNIKEHVSNEYEAAGFAFGSSLGIGFTSTMLIGSFVFIVLAHLCVKRVNFLTCENCSQSIITQ